MLKAVKANQVFDIQENEKPYYLRNGYDIYENGEVVEYATTKTVPYSEYVKLKAEYEKLKAEVEQTGQSEPIDPELKKSNKK